MTVFDFDVMIRDFESNAQKIIFGGYIKIKNITSLPVSIVDSPEFNARIYKTASNQYVLRIYKGLLLKCFEYINSHVRPYYASIQEGCQVSEEQFARTIAAFMTEFIFWHEFSHIARGHIDYVETCKSDWEDSVIRLKEKRLLELDADIYAASFLFARTYSVYVGTGGEFSLQTLMQAYSIGIRSIFEVLHIHNEFEDDTHASAEHPHSLARAYVAIAFGLVSPVAIKIGSDADVCQTIAAAELLSYEVSKKVSEVDISMLRHYLAEAESWGAWSDRLSAYSLLEIHPVPMRTRVAEYLRSCLNFIRLRR
ncbi:hypothetical protein NLO95_14790 [Pseudomonas syringae]|nr:hypothetical protein [Pseudomonas syringae]